MFEQGYSINLRPLCYCFKKKKLVWQGFTGYNDILTGNEHNNMPFIENTDQALASVICICNTYIVCVIIVSKYCSRIEVMSKPGAF